MTFCCDLHDHTRVVNRTLVKPQRARACTTQLVALTSPPRSPSVGAVDLRRTQGLTDEVREKLVHVKTGGRVRHGKQVDSEWQSRSNLGLQAPSSSGIIVFARLDLSASRIIISPSQAGPEEINIRMLCATCDRTSWKPLKRLTSPETQIKVLSVKYDKLNVLVVEAQEKLSVWFVHLPSEGSSAVPAISTFRSLETRVGEDAPSILEQGRGGIAREYADNHPTVHESRT
ncbi:hypothetical protein OG21DRAFT_1521073 [Imleria badia]|nr:hypothetical protein OG21DRAFT_1521073 [Imleria badia]